MSAADGTPSAGSAPLDERTVASGPRLDFSRIRRDVQELAAMERGSAAEEKPQVPWLEQRLRECGAHEVHTEDFRFQRRWIWRHGVHTGGGVAAAALGGLPGAALAAGALVSYELELSGKSHWTGRFLPAGTGTNVVARVPAAGRSERTVVFLAHHDTARTGWLWRSPMMRASFRHARERGGPAPLGTGAEIVMGLLALGCLVGSRALRAVTGAVLGFLTLVGLDVARSRLVPGANDNATAVASLLALVAAFARDPLERTDVVAVFSDCEEVGMGGAEAWVQAHLHELDRANTLIVSLDSLGSGRPAVVTRESPVLAVYPAENLEWADRGALRAAVAPPIRTSLTVTTDGIVAHHAGLRTVSLVSVDEDMSLGPDYHQPTDLPENVDYDCVEQSTTLAAGITRVWDTT